MRVVYTPDAVFSSAFRARVIESRSTFLRRKGWRCLVERQFVGWSTDRIGRWRKTKAHALADADEMLDTLDAAFNGGEYR